MEVHEYLCSKFSLYEIKKTLVAINEILDQQL